MIYDNLNKTITTKRLVLRIFQKSDAVAVTKLCNNYNIYKNTLYLPYPYTIEDALSWIEHHLDNFNANKSYEFAITDKEIGKLYGAIALSNNQKFNNGEIAYWIGKKFWGNGYATEAAQAILHFAFEEKQYHKVFARYFNSNPASGRVMQKLGLKKEGILIDHVRKENRFEDLVYYGIINLVGL
ncbi:GNAT family N-acetyltransferase [Bacillus sp. AFS043905]|uniref:GNAT family N-acetyltransferase n=1 Tax=Peribacillus frigoritolerans TaxID=450367 RepID=UPI000BFB42FD|nr:GNAT family N-acetyltransferase [Peribacillus frigoritolerans]PHD74546.1 GNAT family N-acetyltransferase [Bacillus sp. AFS043905]TWD93800.1 RimJ/RimL family protein N-acetyltransferase [Peribacillus frigoritolerans]